MLSNKDSNYQHDVISILSTEDSNAQHVLISILYTEDNKHYLLKITISSII